MRRIIRSAFPLYLSASASIVGSSVVAATLGNFGTAALAAFALTNAVFIPAGMAVAGALRGSMPFVAAHRDDPEALRPTVKDGMWLAICIGMIGAVAVATVPLTARVAGVPAQTLDALGAFPLILAAALLVTAISVSATSMLIGLGHTTAVMRAGLANTCISVALILTLVLGPGPLPSLGLPGAGLAMLAANLAGAIIAHTALRQATVLAGQPLRPGRPQWARIWRMARVGLPMGATLLIKFSGLGVLAFAVARVSTTEVAAHQVLVVMSTFVFLPAPTVGQASVPLIAIAAKSGDRPGVRRGLLAGLTVTLPVLALSGLMVWIFADTLIRLFTSDPQVHALVLTLIPVLLLSVLADGAQALPGFGLLAMTRTMPSLLTFVIGYGLLSMAAVPIATAGGLTWVWAAYAGTALLLVIGQTAGFWWYSRTSESTSARG
ncbi:MATE family multidrug resistance protein [Streptosporangium lutulentum]|uniref:Probable multidrug resistance protein NorM n=1 Tax=Streptosporangium lutulentum TaxID=1461250 RepID=A0ABT9Q611_9ACTN|nr:MATE family efflux transporter [Streptosporangium lutulentum]MDP9842190.1 MATE family multidrug resistance protein [Streptosporangium lutulentum]